VGGWLRAAGTKDRSKLLDFLERNAASMPRTMLRYAIEHLDSEQREYFRDLRETTGGAP
jgi:3-methyladenine DNA glycosylase AlkD